MVAANFSNIPADLRVPFVYVEIDNSAARLAVEVKRALLIGQRLASGSVAAGQLDLVTSEADAVDKYGQGSMLARMARSYRLNYPLGEMHAVSLDDDGGAVDAVFTITVTGPASGDGTVFLYIAGQRLTIAVSDADTATIIAAAIDVAINAADDLPVTSAAAVGVVTLTARNAGEAANNIDLRDNKLGSAGGEVSPAGVALAFAQTVVGTVNPVITPVLTAIANERFDHFVFPYTDTTSLDALQTELNFVAGRWSPTNQLFGHAWAIHQGTLSELATFGNLRNDPNVTVMGVNNLLEPPWEWAAALAGSAGRRYDIDPARPTQGLELIGISAPDSIDRFTISERQTLLFDGVATYVVTGTAVRIERDITTFQLDSGGNPDASFLDSTTMYTLAEVSRVIKGGLSAKFGAHKLAADGTRFGAGQPIVTPRIIRAEIIRLYADLELRGLVENREAFKAALIVEPNFAANRVDVLFPPDLINQLRVLAILNQFLLAQPAAA